MSTLEIACGRCNKRFRVRAEFAGKATRCPGCSAPLTVASNNPPTPPLPRSRDDDEPRRRRERPRDDERRPTLDENWRSVNTAFRREQTCLLFIAIQVLCDVFIFCAGRMFSPMDAGNPVILLFMLLFGVGPSFGAAAMAVMARTAALSAPASARVRGTAISSLLCAMAALVALVAFGGLILMSLDGSRMNEDMMVVPLGGVLLAALGSTMTFAVYTTQVGIVRQSQEVSTALGRLAVGGTISIIVMIGGACLAMLLAFAFAPPRRGYGYDPYGYNSYQPRYEESIMMVLLLVALPVVSIVMLALYHRLLAAGRRAIESH